MCAGKGDVRGRVVLRAHLSLCSAALEAPGVQDISFFPYNPLTEGEDFM